MSPIGIAEVAMLGVSNVVLVMREIVIAAQGEQSSPELKESMGVPSFTQGRTKLNHTVHASATPL